MMEPVKNKAINSLAINFPSVSFSIKNVLVLIQDLAKLLLSDYHQNS
jgi:hypothetical protein